MKESKKIRGQTMDNIFLHNSKISLANVIQTIIEQTDYAKIKLMEKQ